MKSTLRLAPFLAFPAGVLAAHAILSGIFRLYLIFPNIDIPFHYAGGLSIAYASAQILSFLEREKTVAVLNRIIFLVLIVSLTATAAVFWEFTEFLIDQWLHTNVQVSLANTMQDQFMGILGGATWAFFVYRRS